MIKLLFFINRRADKSVEEFHRYWRGKHAQLVMKHAPTFGVVRYHQSHALPDPRNAPNALFPLRFDGVAELWFESQQALEAWFNNDTPARKAAGKEIRDDERTFVDRARSPYMIAENVPMID